MSAPQRTHGARSLSISSLASVLSHPPSHATLHTLLIPLVILFGISLSSAVQTEVAHALTQGAGYNQPYFTFFLTHITFSLVFPVHLLFLILVRPQVPVRTYLNGICGIIAAQLDSRPTWKAIARPWSIKMAWLTMLISIPALCWFVAMQYSPAMDITAIYATSSFHAYFFSMLLLKQPLSKVTGGSIGLAFAGVIVLSLAGDPGGAGGSEAAGPDGPAGEDGVADGGKRLLGDGIMMIGAVILGLYEVVYKLALPEGHGGVSSGSPTSYDPVPPEGDSEEVIQAEEYGWELPLSPSASPTLSNSNGHSPKQASVSIQLSPKRPQRSKLAPVDRKSSSTPLLGARKSSSPPAPPLPDTFPDSTSRDPAVHDDLYLSPAGPPPPDLRSALPPALHANFITSCIGLSTLLLLWLPIPLLHVLGWEPFLLPSSSSRGSSWGIWASLEIIAWSGAAYNAGLMVLIGIWGPTTSSVANLLTIGLVAVIDAVLMGHLPSLQTMVGVGMICVGFGVLLWEGEG